MKCNARDVYECLHQQRGFKFVCVCMCVCVCVCVCQQGVLLVDKLNALSHASQFLSLTPLLDHSTASVLTASNIHTHTHTHIRTHTSAGLIKEDFLIILKANMVPLLSVLPCSNVPFQLPPKKYNYSVSEVIFCCLFMCFYFHQGHLFIFPACGNATKVFDSSTGSGGASFISPQSLGSRRLICTSCYSNTYFFWTDLTVCPWASRWSLWEQNRKQTPLSLIVSICAASRRRQLSLNVNCYFLHGYSAWSCAFCSVCF